ncbi:MAG: hypothetical protein M1820_004435 [Bogoriella megaspora]|nr:MAG: hypothetical protein M1820_004435 [Bogoriella megaspora]
MRAVTRLAKRNATTQLECLHSTIPTFLCPVLLEAPLSRRPLNPCLSPRSLSSSFTRTSTQNAYISETAESRAPLTILSEKGPAEAIEKNSLPISCPGCGAPSQTFARADAGYYTLSRSAVRNFLEGPKEDAKGEEDEAYASAVAQASDDLKQDLGLQESITQPSPLTVDAVPVCDRCHNLIHHSAGVPIIHPSIDSIEEIISESPYTRNHIYHVLDAVDFPMSLIPSLQRRLELNPLRSQNRRAKHKEYYRGRIAEVSFIITRADLLAPKKEQVDALMPKLKDILRDALGRTAKNARLGNVRCVSAKRGWWTKQVKEDIWDRGGAGWMVGKVNVGKSSLFEVVFPKGRSDDIDIEKLRQEANSGALSSSSAVPETTNEATTSSAADESSGLLPPAQKETQYPVMPIVSALPGTTASPIRVPFGNGKGELIDLPGLERSSLESYVQEDYRRDLVMNHRMVPEQQVIKPGQSMLLGGLIRITPQTPDLIFLTYVFVPIPVHVTSTEKATGIQTGTIQKDVQIIANGRATTRIASAGKFQLKWDVTRQRAGPLTARDAAKLKPDQLHFKVFAADILVEGCGWIEFVAQVRKRRLESLTIPAENSTENGQYTPLEGAEPASEDSKFPTVEVFSPQGKFIGIRPPINGWLMNKKPDPVHARKKRPRPSMRAMKGRRKGMAQLQ